MTPTIVNDVPSSVITRPTTPGSPPNCRCQSPWLSTSTRSASGRSSSARKPRPRTGFVPSTSKNVAETETPRKRAGSEAPVITNCSDTALGIAASRSKLLACRRQSSKFG